MGTAFFNTSLLFLATSGWCHALLPIRLNSQITIIQPPHKTQIFSWENLSENSVLVNETCGSQWSFIEVISQAHPDAVLYENAKNLLCLFWKCEFMSEDFKFMIWSIPNTQTGFSRLESHTTGDYVNMYQICLMPKNHSAFKSHILVTCFGVLKHF